MSPDCTLTLSHSLSLPLSPFPLFTPSLYLSRTLSLSLFAVSLDSLDLALATASHTRFAESRMHLGADGDDTKTQGYPATDAHRPTSLCRRTRRPRHSPLLSLRLVLVRPPLPRRSPANALVLIRGPRPSPPSCPFAEHRCRLCLLPGNVDDRILAPRHTVPPDLPTTLPRSSLRSPRALSFAVATRTRRFAHPSRRSSPSEVVAVSRSTLIGRGKDEETSRIGARADDIYIYTGCPEFKCHNFGSV